MFPLVAVHVINKDQEHSRTRGGLLNSACLGRLKLLCLPRPATSDGCSQERRTLRVVIQYAFSAKSTAPRLRNAGQSAEVSKCQVGFSTALFWWSLPPPGPLLKECMNAAKHKKSEEGGGISVWMGSPPSPPGPPVSETSCGCS